MDKGIGPLSRQLLEILQHGREPDAVLHIAAALVHPRGDLLLGQDAERRPAVDQDVVEGVQVIGQGLGQHPLATDLADQLHLGRGEVDAGRRHRKAVGRDQHVAQLGLAGQDVVDRARERALVDAEGRRKRCLRIDVKQQDAAAGRGEGGAEVDRGGGLTDPAFLVCDREKIGHGRLLGSSAGGYRSASISSANRRLSIRKT